MLTEIIQLSEAIDEATENLRKEVRYCASKTETNIEGIVAYDKLFTNINSIDETVWLDPAVGVFTAQLDGVFRAYVGLQMSWEEKDKHHTITIKVNDEVRSYKVDADAIFQCQ